MTYPSNEASGTQTATPVARFLQAYEANTARGDIPALLKQFADPFMAASPTGAQCVRSSDFALALPKKAELVEGLGRQSTKLVSFQETVLDARFVMVEARWRMIFAREGQAQKEAVVDSMIIVDAGAEDMKIVFYLAHQDLMTSLREQGILPS